MPSAVIVIPARFGSTRFPGKPLLKESGKFLIQHVLDQTAKSKLATRTVVATDDPRIFDAVASIGGHPIMTSPTHPSGTDRIAEVMKLPEFTDTRVVVNVQGDEPEIDPALIDSLIQVTSRPEVPMATAAAPFANPADIPNPNIVKVVTDQNQFALYFSRSVIPHNRDATPGHNSIYHKHLGIYAYQRSVLLAIASSPICRLENLEKLEQLRALYLGFRIHVTFTNNAPHGIDTPEDYAAFLKRYKQSA